MDRDIGFLGEIMYKEILYSEIHRIPENMPKLHYRNQDFLVIPPTGMGIGGDVFTILWDIENIPRLVRVIGSYRENILGKKDNLTGGENGN